jgi:hypothetical protein
MAKDSVWFMASGGRCYRFDLGGKLFEVFEELVGSDASKHNASGNNPMCFWGIRSEGLVKSGVCDGNRYVAVYGTDTYNLTCEYFSLVQRVFKWRLRHCRRGCHRGLPFLTRRT